jgi:hypothetical protein
MARVKSRTAGKVQLVLCEAVVGVGVSSGGVRGTGQLEEAFPFLLLASSASTNSPPLLWIQLLVHSPCHTEVTRPSLPKAVDPAGNSSPCHSPTPSLSTRRSRSTGRQMQSSCKQQGRRSHRTRYAVPSAPSSRSSSPPLEVTMLPFLPADTPLRATGRPEECSPKHSPQRHPPRLRACHQTDSSTRCRRAFGRRNHLERVLPRLPRKHHTLSVWQGQKMLNTTSRAGSLALAARSGGDVLFRSAEGRGRDGQTRYGKRRKQCSG